METGDKDEKHAIQFGKQNRRTNEHNNKNTNVIQWRHLVTTTNPVIHLVKSASIIEYLQLSWWR